MVEKPLSIEASTSRSNTPLWRDERVLRAAAQILSAAVVIGILWWSIDNVITSAAQRGLSLGFQFLGNSAGFPIAESPIPYDPSQSFAYAFLVGVLNTLKVSVVGIFFSTLLGLLVGLARLSSNWLVSRIALAYIEIHRNIPLLVLLFLWYSGLFLQLPRVRESIVWPGPVYLNQRGLYITWPRLAPGGEIFAGAIVVGIVLAVVAWITLRRRRATSGRPTYYGLVSAALLGLVALAGWLLSGGAPFVLDTPFLSGFNFRGGLRLSPEFAALLIGLVTYTAAFIAEVVRAGIQSVNRGQLEAARALGLRPAQVMSLIVFPQALRVIIPPLISQYLNLAKNSSLAFFIGYTDLFFIGTTMINQAGRAIQVFLLVMGVYLVISLVTSSILNLYNRRIQLVER
jgi:general L-amino acid transport system permease protein